MYETNYIGAHKEKSGWLKKTVLGLLLLVFMWHFGFGVYIQVKAHVAQLLIAKAWEQQIKTGEYTSPWPWADTFPIAKLNFPSHSEQLYALATSTDAIIAFGPGHVVQSTFPGQLGNSIFVGHNDTHFNFLKNIEFGDLIEVSTVGETFLYKVESIRIAHENDVDAIDSRGGNNNANSVWNESRLTLITCYPFDSLAADTEFRYLVQGKMINPLEM